MVYIIHTHQHQRQQNLPHTSPAPTVLLSPASEYSLIASCIHILVLTSLIWAIHNLNNDDSIQLPVHTTTTTTTTTNTPATDINTTIIVHITQWNISEYGSIVTSILISIIMIVSYIIEYVEFYNSQHNGSSSSSTLSDSNQSPTNFVHFLYTQIYSANNINIITPSSSSPQYMGRYLSRLCCTLAYTSLALSKLIPRILPYIRSILQSYIINNEVASVYIMSVLGYILAIILPRIVLVTSVGGMCYNLTLVAYTSTTTTTTTVNTASSGTKPIGKRGRNKVGSVSRSMNSSSTSSNADSIKRRHLLAYIMYLMCLLCLLTTRLTHVIILTLSLLIACHFWYIISTITSLERIPLASYTYASVQHDRSTDSKKSTTTTPTHNTTSIAPLPLYTSDDDDNFGTDICIPTPYNYDVIRVKIWVCKHVYDTICTSILSLPTHDATTTSKIVRENTDETNKQFNNDNNERDQRGSNNTSSKVYNYKLQRMIVTAVYLFIWGRFLYFTTDHRHIISKLQVSYPPRMY